MDADETYYALWREQLEQWLVEEDGYSPEAARAEVAALPLRAVKSIGMALKWFKNVRAHRHLHQG